MSQLSTWARHASSELAGVTTTAVRTLATKKGSSENAPSASAPKFKRTPALYRQATKEHAEVSLLDGLETAQDNHEGIKEYLTAELLYIKDPVLREQIRVEEAKAVEIDKQKKDQYQKILISKEDATKKVQELISIGAPSDVVLNALYHLMPRTAPSRYDTPNIDALEWKPNYHTRRRDEIDYNGFDVEDSSDPENLPRQRPFTKDEMNRILQDVEESRFIESDVDDALFAPAYLMADFQELAYLKQVQDKFTSVAAAADVNMKLEDLDYDSMVAQFEKNKIVDNVDELAPLALLEGTPNRLFTDLPDVLLEYQQKRELILGLPPSIGYNSGALSAEEKLTETAVTNAGLGLPPKGIELGDLPLVRLPEKVDRRDPFDDMNNPFLNRFDDYIAEYLNKGAAKRAINIDVEAEAQEADRVHAAVHGGSVASAPMTAEPEVVKSVEYSPIQQYLKNRFDTLVTKEKFDKAALALTREEQLELIAPVINIFSHALTVDFDEAEYRKEFDIPEDEPVSWIPKRDDIDEELYKDFRDIIPEGELTGVQELRRHLTRDLFDPKFEAERVGDLYYPHESTENMMKNFEADDFELAVESMAQYDPFSKYYDSIPKGIKRTELLAGILQDPTSLLTQTKKGESAFFRKQMLRKNHVQYNHIISRGQLKGLRKGLEKYSGIPSHLLDFLEVFHNPRRGDNDFIHNDPNEVRLARKINLERLAQPSIKFTGERPENSDNEVPDLATPITLDQTPVNSAARHVQKHLKRARESDVHKTLERLKDSLVTEYGEPLPAEAIESEQSGTDMEPYFLKIRESILQNHADTLYDVKPEKDEDYLNMADKEGEVEEENFLDLSKFKDTEGVTPDDEAVISHLVAERVQLHKLSENLRFADRSNRTAFRRIFSLNPVVARELVERAVMHRNLENPDNVPDNQVIEMETYINWQVELRALEDSMISNATHYNAKTGGQFPGKPTVDRGNKNVFSPPDLITGEFAPLFVDSNLVSSGDELVDNEYRLPGFASLPFPAVNVIEHDIVNVRKPSSKGSEQPVFTEFPVITEEFAETVQLKMEAEIKLAADIEREKEFLAKVRGETVPQTADQSDVESSAGEEGIVATQASMEETTDDESSSSGSESEAEPTGVIVRVDNKSVYIDATGAQRPATIDDVIADAIKANTDARPDKIYIKSSNPHTDKSVPYDPVIYEPTVLETIIDNYGVKKEYDEIQVATAGYPTAPPKYFEIRKAVDALSNTAVDGANRNYERHTSDPEYNFDILRSDLDDDPKDQTKNIVRSYYEDMYKQADFRGTSDDEYRDYQYTAPQERPEDDDIFRRIASPATYFSDPLNPRQVKVMQSIYDARKVKAFFEGQMRPGDYAFMHSNLGINTKAMDLNTFSDQEQDLARFHRELVVGAVREVIQKQDIIENRLEYDAYNVEPDYDPQHYHMDTHNVFNARRFSPYSSLPLSENNIPPMIGLEQQKHVYNLHLLDPVTFHPRWIARRLNIPYTTCIAMMKSQDLLHKMYTSDPHSMINNELGRAETDDEEVTDVDELGEVLADSRPVSPHFDDDIYTPHPPEIVLGQGDPELLFSRFAPNLIGRISWTNKPEKHKDVAWRHNIAPDLHIGGDEKAVQMWYTEKELNRRWVAKEKLLDALEKAAFARFGSLTWGNSKPGDLHRPPKLPREIISSTMHPPSRHNWVLTSLDEAKDNIYAICVRDRDGYLRHPTYREFRNVRFREKDRRLPFYWRKYHVLGKLPEISNLFIDQVHKLKRDFDQRNIADVSTDEETVKQIKQGATMDDLFFESEDDEAELFGMRP